ncbi:MAG: hypothetical protein E6Q51_05390 [Methylophilus methylotrophus]|uniref:Uncharacterized protein n=1 Tax=Methylophilus methylotrophus TaxID=17 RepID=A0A5C7WIS5_METME|nr:MAG: hypothetical protein E6Q51_05390 [Methylophilus methylotrophus]
MKFLTLKRAWLAPLSQYLFFLAMTLGLGIGASLAEESSAPYQSTFDDYKATNNDNQTDWKSLDASIAGQGQQMSGMQHSSDQPMNHEAMGHGMSHRDTQASHDSKSEMPRMDHPAVVHGEASESAIPSQGSHSAHQHEPSEGDSHEH